MQKEPINISSTSWTTLSWSSLNPYHDLKSRIQQIANKTIKNELTGSEVTDLKQAFNLSLYRILSFTGLKSEVAKISLEQMEAFLTALTEKDDVEGVLKNYFENFENSQLMELLNYQTEVDVINFIGNQALSKETALKGIVEKEGKAILNQIYTTFTTFVHQFIKMLIGYTGIKELLEEPEFEASTYEAKMRFDFFKEFLSSPRVLFEFFALYFKFFPAMTLTAASLAAIPIGAFTYERYFKKCPRVVSGMENLKDELSLNKEPIYSRKGVLNRIEDAFLEGKSVLLVGESGCGKTKAVQSFVLEIMAGRNCEFAKNPEIFGGNASDFAVLRSSSSFHYLKKTLQDHKDQVVMFLDEFAALFKGEGIDGKAPVDQLKTFVDKFHYVIGATTMEEYKEYIKGDPTIKDRRFRVIKLKSSDNEELEAIVYHHILETNPEIEITEDAVAHLVKKAVELNPKTAKITAVKSFLLKAIAKITDLSFKELNDELNTLINKRSDLEAKFIATRVPCDLKSIDEEIKVKREKKNRKIEKRKNLERVEAIYLKTDRKSFQMASASVDEHLMSAWLKNEASAKMMKYFIQKKKEKLKLFSQLNKDLIDSIVKEKNKLEI